MSWESRLQAWEGRFKAWEGRFQAWEGLGGTNGRTNGRNDEQKSPCVLQDFVPFGAAAQKTKVNRPREDTKKGEEYNTGRMELEEKNIKDK